MGGSEEPVENRFRVPCDRHTHTLALSASSGGGQKRENVLWRKSKRRRLWCAQWLQCYKAVYTKPATRQRGQKAHSKGGKVSEQSPVRISTPWRLYLRVRKPTGEFSSRDNASVKDEERRDKLDNKSPFKTKRNTGECVLFRCPDSNSSSSSFFFFWS